MGGFGEQFTGLETSIGGLGESITAITDRLDSIEQGIKGLKTDDTSQAYTRMNWQPFSEWGRRRTQIMGLYTKAVYPELSYKERQEVKIADSDITKSMEWFLT